MRRSVIHLDSYAQSQLEREAVRWRLRETGGSLFGWHQNADIVVACVSGPGPRAKHRLTSFQPSPTTTRTAIERVVDHSGGRYRYLGSWHTHPRGAPLPSGTDTDTAQGMAEQLDLELPSPLFLILGTTGTSRRVKPSKLCAWTWKAESQTLEQAEIAACVLSDRHGPDAADLFLPTERREPPISALAR